MIRQQIPNAITLCNLFCGCAAVLHLAWGLHTVAVYWLLGALLADFLDGAVARLLGVSSPLGAQLDSLADMVSFGVVPGLMLYQLLNASLGLSGWSWWSAPAFLLTLFSAVRLAKFNLDSRQKTHFIGLATPAATLFCIGLLLPLEYDTWRMRAFLLQPFALYAMVLLLSYLLVAELPMFAFKFGKNTTPTSTRYAQMGFVIGAILMLFFFDTFGLSLSVMAYVLLNLVIKNN
jgi:CDP-diacylglycerol---serine O-phosphatidyltransferase